MICTRQDIASLAALASFQEADLYVLPFAPLYGLCCWHGEALLATGGLRGKGLAQIAVRSADDSRMLSAKPA